MPNKRGPPAVGTIAFVVVAIVAVATMGLTSTFFTPTSKMTSTTETTRTCTEALPPTGANVSFYIFYCSDPLRITAISGTNGSWNFTASISRNSVSAGQSILLMTTLTNISEGNQTIKEFVLPFINPGVYDAKGTEIWAWNPPQIVTLSRTITNGESISQSVTIPTSGLTSGQTYLISVNPLPIQFLLMSGERLAFQFSVR
jgi:hypothetical protein